MENKQNITVINIHCFSDTDLHIKDSVHYIRITLMVFAAHAGIEESFIYNVAQFTLLCELS